MFRYLPHIWLCWDPQQHKLDVENLSCPYCDIDLFKRHK